MAVECAGLSAYALRVTTRYRARGMPKDAGSEHKGHRLLVHEVLPILLLVHCQFANTYSVPLFWHEARNRWRLLSDNVFPLCL